jgi:signal transduction histidine kinase
MPVQQILLNLIDNAIKHHDKAQGHIEVTVDDAGDFLVFAVSDDGPGIPEEHQQHVLEMFKTLKSRDRVEGSGMGLAMVKKHVELAGGALTLQSREGAGSRFQFTWPKPVPQPEHDDGQKAAPASSFAGRLIEKGARKAEKKVAER